MRQLKFRGYNSETKVMGELKTLWLDIKYKDHVHIMQYTGLKDKSKKEIYKGDLFMINSKVYYVEYIEDLCRYVLTTGKGYDTLNCMDLTCDTIFDLSIIGNIFENAELLNK